MINNLKYRFIQTKIKINVGSLYKMGGSDWIWIIKMKLLFHTLLYNFSLTSNLHTNYNYHIPYLIAVKLYLIEFCTDAVH